MDPLMLTGALAALALFTQQSDKKKAEAESFTCPVCTSDAYRNEPPCSTCERHHDLLAKQDVAIKKMRDAIKTVREHHREDVQQQERMWDERYARLADRLAEGEAEHGHKVNVAFFKGVLFGASWAFGLFWLIG